MREIENEMAVRLTKLHVVFPPALCYTNREHNGNKNVGCSSSNVEAFTAKSSVLRGP